MSEHSHEYKFWLPDLCRPLALLRLLLLGVLIASVLALLRRGVSGIEWSYLGLLFFYSIWIVFLAAAGLCGMRRMAPRIRYFQGPVGVLIAVLWLLLAASICCLFAYYVGGPGLLSSHYSLASFWLETSLITLILGSVLFRFLYVHQALQSQQRRLMQAEFDTLQARIKPHFLFNSLNSIATLVATDSRRAEDAVLNLSDLLRATLAEKDSIDLRRELETCRKYLEIEKLRMDERLQATFEIPEDLMTLPVPALFLQPLVENAILHGLQKLPEGGELRVLVRRQEGRRDRVQIRVENPVAPAGYQASSGSHTALQNIRARLESFYAGAVEFNTMNEGGRFCVDISVPWLE